MYNYIVIKTFLIKYKKILLVILAVLFLVVLFLIKNKTIFKNSFTLTQNKQENGLTYGDMTIEDLVDRDTDIDGIPDWQEGLYGLDPTKKETTPGTPDSSALEKLRATQEKSATTQGGGNASALNTENLTQTEKFSRELFTTVAALNQNGTVDQATIDALGNSLAEKIENPPQRKIYTISDIKITNNDTKQTIQKYSDTLNNIYLKQHVKKGVPTILQEFTEDETNIDKLSELDPIINQANQIIGELLKIQVPQSLSLLHLDLINDSQSIVENISDIKFFESDPVVAIGAIVQYGKNVLTLESSARKLINTIKQKLSN